MSPASTMPRLGKGGAGEKRPETIKHTSRSQSIPPRHRYPLNTTVGTSELCAWQPVPGVTWVQTRSAEFARKLSRRHDSRLVAYSVAGGYLRTFEFFHSLAWALRLITRYQRLTNEAKPPPKCPGNALFHSQGDRAGHGGQRLFTEANPVSQQWRTPQ